MVAPEMRTPPQGDGGLGSQRDASTPEQIRILAGTLLHQQSTPLAARKRAQFGSWTKQRDTPQPLWVRGRRADEAIRRRLYLDKSCPIRLSRRNALPLAWGETALCNLASGIRKDDEMSRCSVCKSLHHNASAHNQCCAICGKDPVVKQHVEDVNPSYHCKDTARHEEIRLGFGQPLLVGEAKLSAGQRRRRDKNQLSLL